MLSRQDFFIGSGGVLGAMLLNGCSSGSPTALTSGAQSLTLGAPAGDSQNLASLLQRAGLISATENGQTYYSDGRILPGPYNMSNLKLERNMTYKVYSGIDSSTKSLRTQVDPAPPTCNSEGQCSADGYPLDTIGAVNAFAYTGPNQSGFMFWDVGSGAPWGLPPATGPLFHVGPIPIGCANQAGAVAAATGSAMAAALYIFKNPQTFSSILQNAASQAIEEWGPTGFTIAAAAAFFGAIFAEAGVTATVILLLAIGVTFITIWDWMHCVFP